MNKITPAIQCLVITLFIPLFSVAQTKQKSTDKITTAWIDQNLREAAAQYKILIQNVPEGVMPRSFKDSLSTCTSDNWTSGFYPGTLVYLSEATNNPAFQKEAIRKATLMDKEQYNRNTHDLGFMMYCSYGNINRVRPSNASKEILLNSARSLASRFNEKTGCIRSWGKPDDTTEFRVIIDNMMNLELLFWAARTSGDASFRRIALTHANTTMKNHFRPDYSSYHVVVYDPKTGAVIKKQTAQGAADESAWARGQSWGLYGYTLMYRETKDKKYLDHAQHIANFLLHHPNLPADKIPFWDYNAPGIPDTYRDASAAAVMASALIELAGYSSRENATQYLDVAATILKTLSGPSYKAAIGDNGGFLLKHSVVHLPKNVEVDVALPYADYYYVEAMMRYRKMLGRK